MKRAAVRETHEEISKRVGTIGRGEVVAVVSSIGNRLKVVRLRWGDLPNGWVSEREQDGKGVSDPHSAAASAALRQDGLTNHADLPQDSLLERLPRSEWSSPNAFNDTGPPATALCPSHSQSGRLGCATRTRPVRAAVLIDPCGCASPQRSLPVWR